MQRIIAAEDWIKENYKNYTVNELAKHFGCKYGQIYRYLMTRKMLPPKKSSVGRKPHFKKMEDETGEFLTDRLMKEWFYVDY
jgi:hypothetical protein